MFGLMALLLGSAVFGMAMTGSGQDDAPPIDDSDLRHVARPGGGLEIRAEIAGIDRLLGTVENIDTPEALGPGGLVIRPASALPALG